MMRSRLVRNSLFATLFAAAGSLAFTCHFIEARGGDAAPPAASAPLKPPRRLRSRKRT